MNVTLRQPAAHTEKRNSTFGEYTEQKSSIFPLKVLLTGAEMEAGAKGSKMIIIQ